MHVLKPFLIVFLLCSAFLHAQVEAVELRVLQFNIWQEGTKVENGFNTIITEIIENDADLIALSEVRNYDGVTLNDRLVNALKVKGYTYYSEKSEDSGGTFKVSHFVSIHYISTAE
ncbi:endonuclease/exonuclease/phosphatase [Formosa agariphila KMM 3901]|uniref:Endonuclease/exonuclease/phosphatase n=1 Tax=Formosa agariphila (strain DSM 15362 / KCTC 12365 / LMG 23005 / KMM 3901 / M-2Alg 35-1) TaxID=1347342 RepID=T2KNP3_FORAG|nr:hypothetical protein [Formosa agariphila]CDF80340.1 endonuclease/exonuclease/phosphatase [Formosa agariphila KMM 3901]